MQFQNARAVLVIDELAPSLRFWVDRLGFRKTAEAHDGSYAIVNHQTIEIMLQSRRALVASAPHLAGPTFCTTLYVEVADVEAVVPVIADTDVVIPLRKTPYGMHEIFVREPGGHIIGFASPLPESR